MGNKRYFKITVTCEDKVESVIVPNESHRIGGGAGSLIAKMTNGRYPPSEFEGAIWGELTTTGRSSMQRGDVVISITGEEVDANT